MDLDHTRRARRSTGAYRIEAQGMSDAYEAHASSCTVHAHTLRSQKRDREAECDWRGFSPLPLSSPAHHLSQPAGPWRWVA